MRHVLLIAMIVTPFAGCALYRNRDCCCDHDHEERTDLEVGLAIAADILLSGMSDDDD